MYVKIIGSTKLMKQIGGTVPITYFEAALLYQKYGKRFSFIHYNPIDGDCDGRMTMVDFAFFIRPEMWDAYLLRNEDRD